MTTRPIRAAATAHLLLLALLSAVPSARAADEAKLIRAAGRLGFSADVASFPGEDGHPRTDLYISIPLTSLRYTEKVDRPPTAEVSIVAVFYRDGRQLTGDDWSYYDIPGSTKPDGNEGRSLDRRYEFPLPPGKVTAKVRVVQPGTGQGGLLEFEFRVPDFAREPLAVSDLVFGLCPEMVRFAPQENLVGPILPHPSRRYGEAIPEACVYAEILDSRPDGPDAYLVDYKVKSESGTVLEDSTVAVDRLGGRGELLLRPRLQGLSLGSFELETRIRLGDDSVERSGSFEVDETRIAFIRDAEKLRTVLGYVATNQERARLESAPDDSLEAIWEAFWERRDPSEDTRRNENMVEFLRRVEYVTNNFSVMEPGWRSDMGRIYIKYGAADQIERFVDETYRYPTEIWYYYSRDVTFIFQDQDGFGRYRLVGTKE